MNDERFNKLPELEHMQLRSRVNDVVVYGFSLDDVLVYKDNDKFTCPWLLNHGLRSISGFDSLEKVKEKFAHYLSRDISTLENRLLKKVEISADLNTVKKNKLYAISLRSAIATYYKEKTEYDFKWTIR